MRTAASSTASETYLAEPRFWPALILRAPAVSPSGESSHDAVSVLLDDLDPAAIEDLEPVPVPGSGLWDPTAAPVPEPQSQMLDWRVYFKSDRERDHAAAVLTTHLGFLAVTRVDVRDQDWAARSQQSLRAVRAGAFIVAPPWDVPRDPEGATLIIIEPSMGFGTGHHPTTRLCLKALGRCELRDRSVLDIGTGSGVLAVAAALRGAAPVRGVDADRDAIASAEASVTANHVERSVQLAVLDFRQGALEAADALLANLTGGMLTSSAGCLSGLVHPAGTLILSGFDHTEEAGVREAFASWTPAERDEEEGWIALTMMRGEMERAEA